MASDEDEAILLQGLFQPGALVQLLDLCGTAPTRVLVMCIALAIPSAEAAVAVQTRYVIHSYAMAIMHVAVCRLL